MTLQHKNNLQRLQKTSVRRANKGLTLLWLFNQFLEHLCVVKLFAKLNPDVRLYCELFAMGL